MGRKMLAALACVGATLAALVAAGGAALVARGAPASPVLATRTVGPDPGAVAIDERAGHAFVINSDDTLSMLATGDGRVLRTITLNSAPIALAVDTRHGDALVVSQSFVPEGSSSVATLDTRTGSFLRTVGVGQGAGAIAVDTRAGRAYVTNSGDDTLSTLDLASSRVLRTVPVGLNRGTGYDPVAIAVDARAGRVFTTNNANNSISMFDASGRLLRVIPLGKLALNSPGTVGPQPLAVWEAGKRLFVAGNAPSGSGGFVRALDTRSGATVWTIRMTWSPAGLAMDTRTGRVVVPNADGPGLLLDARSGAIVSAIDSGSSPWGLVAGTVIDDRAGLVYLLRGAAHDNTGATVGTGSLLALNGATGRVVRTIPVGLLPRNLGLDPRAGRLVVVSLNDREYNRYGYRARAIGPDPWAWIPGPVRGLLPLPRAAGPSITPSGPLSGTVSIIDTTP